MSLLNQVLRDLDQRDAPAPNVAQQAQLRPAESAPDRPGRGPWVASVLVVIGAVAIWMYREPAMLQRAWRMVAAPIASEPAVRILRRVNEADLARAAAETPELPAPTPQPAVPAQPAIAVVSSSINPIKVSAPGQPAAAPADLMLRLSPNLTWPPEVNLPVRQVPAIERRARPLADAGRRPVGAENARRPRQDALSGGESKSPVRPTAVIEPRGRGGSTPRELAEIHFAQGITLEEQGAAEEAIVELRKALDEDATHTDARQHLVRLLLERKRLNEAQVLLAEAFLRDSANTGTAQALARVQVERNDLSGAINTLQSGLPHARTDGAYRAFLAAVLQRAGRHADSIPEFQHALERDGNNPLWRIGLGISQQATGKTGEARENFKLALNNPALNAEMRAFASDRVRQLSAETRK